MHEVFVLDMRLIAVFLRVRGFPAEKLVAVGCSETLTDMA